jgi:hypothetical protein
MFRVARWCSTQVRAGFAFDQPRECSMSRRPFTIAHDDALLLSGGDIEEDLQ